MDVLVFWPIILVVTQIVIYFLVGLLLIFLNEFRTPEHGGEFKAVDEYSAKVSENPVVLRRETWEAWAGAIHPGWLLGVRIVSFLYLSGMLILVYARRQSWVFVFYYYTEWTLTLLIVYFGWATFVSIFEYHYNLQNFQAIPVVETSDMQQSILIQDEGDVLGTAYPYEEDTYSSGATEAKAGYFGFTLQILFQTVAPAVVLTDGIYWTLLYPYFPDNFPHTFLEYNLHGVNAVFLVAEIFLNSMRFPWFRAAYFFVYSCLYVFFQWFIHVSGCVNPGSWPYPFLEVSTANAPLWYFAIGILHISAYATISFLNRLKLVFQERDLTITRRARCWSLARSLCPCG